MAADFLPSLQVSPNYTFHLIWSLFLWLSTLPHHKQKEGQMLTTSPESLEVQIDHRGNSRDPNQIAQCDSPDWHSPEPANCTWNKTHSPHCSLQSCSSGLCPPLWPHHMPLPILVPKLLPPLTLSLHCPHIWAQALAIPSARKTLSQVSTCLAPSHHSGLKFDGI